MPATRRRTSDGLTVFAGAVSVALLMITIIIGVLAWETQTRLGEQTYDDSGIAAVQTRLHYELLVGEVRLLSAGATTDGGAEASLQFDILYDRLKSLPTRPPYPELLDDEILKLTVDTFHALAKFVPAFDALRDAGTPLPPSVLPGLQSLRPAIERISGRAVQLAPSFKQIKRQRSLDGLQWLMAAVIALVISAGVFAFLLLRSLRRESQHNRELAIARDQAVRANNAKSTFLAQMSHELRTPLNAIIGFSDLIVSEVHGPADKHYVGYASDVSSAGRRLLHLISELLDLARIEAGKLELRLGDVDFADVQNAFLRVTTHRAKESKIKISVDDRTSRTIRCDELKMTQILINLVDNAIKFSPSESEIAVRADFSPEGAFLLTVEDQGCGIGPDELAKVMEPFAQVESRQARISNPGVGLGLPIVLAMVELHGGSIDIASELNRGTRVSMIFPQAAALVGDDD